MVLLAQARVRICDRFVVLCLVSSFFISCFLHVFCFFVTLLALLFYGDAPAAIAKFASKWLSGIVGIMAFGFGTGLGGGMEGWIRCPQGSVMSLGWT